MYLYIYYIIILLLPLATGDTTVYYVSTITTDCYYMHNCHTLSHYISNITRYFTSDVTFIFEEGEHLLDSAGTELVLISDAHNLILRGETTASNVTITCGNSTGGLWFINSSHIAISGITITDCGKIKTTPLSLTHIIRADINNVSIINGRNVIALHIYDMLYLHISNSRFINNENIAVYIGIVCYSKITGASFTQNRQGLEIYNEQTIYCSGEVSITNCRFSNNSHYAMTINKTHYVFMYSCVIFGNGQHGMEVAAVIKGYEVLAKLENCTFLNNMQGGLLIRIFENNATSESYVLIGNSTFVNNTIRHTFSIDYGGGMTIFVALIKSINVDIKNCQFINNTVATKFGSGGLSILSIVKVYTIINNTVFYNNIAQKGGGVNIESVDALEIVFDNSIFYKSGIYIKSVQYTTAYGFLCAIRLSHVVISNNNDSGIHTFNCLLEFTEGCSIIANNSSPSNGGGIYLDGKCTIVTTEGGSILLINNTAKQYGGAIYSINGDELWPGVRLKANTLCTLDYNKFNVSFQNNCAEVAGDQLYGGTFFHCSINLNGSLKFLFGDILNCSYVPLHARHSTIHPLSPVSSDPLAICLCMKDNTIDCSVRSVDRVAYPGQMFSISLVTVGLCGGVSPGTLVITSNDNVSFTSDTNNDQTSTDCKLLQYIPTVKNQYYTSVLNEIFISIPNNQLFEDGYIQVNLTLLSCPPGLVLSPTTGDCVCNNITSKLNGVSCNISWVPYPILRSGNSWIALHKYNCTIVHTGCPFDYCNTSLVKLSLTESDLQCNYNRSGILCGKCKPGLSLMIGCNKCSNCTNVTVVSISIVILVGLAGIILVTLLIALNLTVSIGSINGILFYANIVKLNEAVFFPQGNIPVISQFISWLNLDLGIEYCFIDGLDGYIKTWLQFVFPLYLWLLVIAIIVGCRYSGRLSRLCGNNTVPVLATLILMSYTKLLRTITNSLMVNTIQCEQYKWSVWYVDGNIHYLDGKHIALFAIALLFLITGLVYTGLVFSSQWLQRYSGKCCKSTSDPIVQLKPLVDAYTGPYKDKYRFWTGLGMMARLILTIVFSFTTGKYGNVNNLVIFTIMLIPSMINTGNRVYKDIRVSTIEAISIINLLLLSFMTTTFSNIYPKTVSTTTITTVSVAIEIVLFIVVATGHLYCRVANHFRSTSKRQRLNRLITSDDDCNVINRREPLIFIT